MNVLRIAKKGISYLKHYGLKDFVVRLEEKRDEAAMPYESWYESHKVSETVLKQQQAEVQFWENRPKISIVTPLYHTPEGFLREMIASVRAQSYGNWELCLADGSGDKSLERTVWEASDGDVRIRYQNLGENRGIAGNTNAAIEMATGDWISFLDHDDLLSPDALFEAAKKITKEKADEPLDLIYTDEDKIDTEGKRHFSPHFKPDWNPDLLCSNNYITHFLLVRKSLAEKVGAVEATFDGAQDHDYILRCTEMAEHIAHIPKILYHWRCHAASTAENPLSKQYAVDAGVRAVSEHFKRIGVNALVQPTKDMGFYRTTYPLEEHPLVSVIVTGDETDGRRLLKKTDYRELEFLSEQEKENAKGTYLLFVDNSLEPEEADWLEKMLGICMRPDVGVVGAKILTATGRIFHAGMVTGTGKQRIADNVFHGMKGSHSGYMHRASLQMNYSAVNGCCLLIKKSVYDDCSYGIKDGLSPAAGALDLCLKVREQKNLVVYEPGAVLRMKDRKAEKRWNPETAWLKKDRDYLKLRWKSVIEKPDACYNPNFGTDRAGYSLVE